MKVLSVFGTRPEAIKMAPIVLALKERGDVESIVAVTGQHREMLDQVLDIFGIVPDYDLDIFTPGQSLTDIAVRSLRGLEDIFKTQSPTCSSFRATPPPSLRRPYPPSTTA